MQDLLGVLGGMGAPADYRGVDARVVELADTGGLNPPPRKRVWVRTPPRAPQPGCDRVRKVPDGLTTLTRRRRQWAVHADEFLEISRCAFNLALT